MGTTHNIINIFSELELLAKHSAPRSGSLGALEAVVGFWFVNWKIFKPGVCEALGRTEPLAVSSQGVQREGKEIQIVLSKMFVKIMNIIFLSINTFLSLLIIKLMKHQLQSVQCNQ